MKVVVDNEEQARERGLSATAIDTIGKWYDKCNYPLSKTALKKGEFWTSELLEFYVSVSQTKAQIYYFKEFLPDQYVLIKTRQSMERISDCKVVTLLEQLSGHKLWIRNIKGGIPVEELIDNTNFDILIDTRDVDSPYNSSTFISIDLCKKVKVTEDKIFIRPLHERV